MKVTVWSHHRERIGEWIIASGQPAVFEVDGERIKVRPGYKIKVGDDWEGMTPLTRRDAVLAEVDEAPEELPAAASVA